jgi:epoxyqueuosine reductase
LTTEPILKTDDRKQLTSAVKQAAREVGFDLVGVAPAVSPPGFDSFTRWLEQGFAGDMQYMARRTDAYQHPCHVMPTVRSIIMLAINYRPPDESSNAATATVPARIARYAQSSLDYHDFFRGKLKQLSEKIHQIRPGCRTRGVVDTAPLLERDFAKLAGLGWFGKNTMIINKRAGSWLLLAALLTDLDLELDSSHDTSHCGTCTRCLDVCPTDAFPAPYVLDARRCISYLTIELRTSIPTDLRDGIGDWLFGCDLCQEVCPWNRKAPHSKEPALRPLPDMASCDAIEILNVSESDFKIRFADTPLSRPGWDGLRRNAAIVLGNSGNPTVISMLLDHAQDPSPLVREAVEWALEKLQRGQTD